MCDLFEEKILCQKICISDFCINEFTVYKLQKSPGEIKRREVSWTLTKKLDTFPGPGEIKRRKLIARICC